MADDVGAPEAQYDTSWEQLPVDQRLASIENVDVYLDDFISVVQGFPKERRQLLQHLFHKINRVLRPNDEADMDRK